MLSPIESTMVNALAANLPPTYVTSRYSQRHEMPASLELLEARGGTFLARVAYGTKSQTMLRGNYVDWTFPEPTPADIAVGQIMRLKMLDADWDGNGAARPLEFSLNDAAAFIRSLAPHSMIPKPTLHADGHAILLQRKPGMYVELEFMEGKMISYFARHGEESWSGEFRLYDGEPPEGLLRVGFTFS